MKSRNEIKKVANMTVEMMFDAMPESKKRVFRAACNRNFDLTSCYILGFSTLTVYKEGWYISMRGTRSGFGCFMKDCDGEMKMMKKPKDEKLNKLWSFEWYNEMPIDQYAI